MGFVLSEEQKIFQASARRFFEKELAPIVDDLEEAGEFPRDFYQLCAKHGFLGLSVPEEYGGSGADALTCTLLVEEAFRVCAGAAATILTASLLAPMLIIAEGNEEQKKKYLPGIPTGERVIAFTLTEPNAGSDTAGIQTVAGKIQLFHAADYIINIDAEINAIAHGELPTAADYPGYR